MKAERGTQTQVRVSRISLALQGQTAIYSPLEQRTLCVTTSLSLFSHHHSSHFLSSHLSVFLCLSHSFFLFSFPIFSFSFTFCFSFLFYLFISSLHSSLLFLLLHHPLHFIVFLHLSLKRFPLILLSASLSLSLNCLLNKHTHTHR